MAPMKLEDKMKERLEERTIDPSAAAWDRIAAKLETQAVVKKVIANCGWLLRPVLLGA